MAQAPGIEQAICRPGIETHYAAISAEHRDIGDAAQVEHDGGLSRSRQQHGMQRGQKRCALPAGGNVASTKIRHHIDMAPFGDHRRIAQLQGEGEAAPGAVPQRLAVGTDGSHLRRR